MAIEEKKFTEEIEALFECARDETISKGFALFQANQLYLKRMRAEMLPLIKSLEKMIEMARYSSGSDLDDGDIDEAQYHLLGWLNSPIDREQE